MLARAIVRPLSRSIVHSHAVLSSSQASWSIVTSPNMGTNNNGLFSVANISASDIWAVGAYGNTNFPGSAYPAGFPLSAFGRKGWTGFDKTLWEWMQLLIIPAALAIAGFLFTRAERRSTLAAEQQQAEIERQAVERRVQWEQQLAEQRAATERFLAQWRLETEMKQKEEYQREALLQAYFDRMADLPESRA